MKTINWLILCVFVLLAGGWVFNHVNVWLGFAIWAVEVYLIVWKAISIIKGEVNAKKV